MPMLEISNLRSGYGDVLVLEDVNLSVSEGEGVCVIGRNGVGKSTLFKSIIREDVSVTNGAVDFLGKPISNLKSHEIARLGVAFVPEERRVFASLSVDENLRVPKPAIPAPGSRKRIWTMDMVYEVFPELARIKRRRAGYLSGGEQQMLSIARAMLMSPDLLILDEPHEGLAPKIREVITKVILSLKQMGVSMLISEQSLEVVRDCADRVYIIDHGTIVFGGTVHAFYEQPELIKKHLMVG